MVDGRQAPPTPVNQAPVPQAPVGRARRDPWGPEPEYVRYDPIPKLILDLHLCANYNERAASF